MLTQEKIQALKAPFPQAALSSDTSRGFALTSIKAAFVIERLNDVFGPCGSGWRYVHSPFEMLETKNGGIEVVTEVAFQYRLTGEQDGCAPIEWCGLTNDWSMREPHNGNWSEPILACGGKSVSKGGAPHTDARKSAVTDGLTKAASMIGVGHQVFKGQVRVGQNAGNGHHPPVASRHDKGNGKHPASQKPAASATPSNAPQGNGKQPTSPQQGNGAQVIKTEADATTFWSLYNREAKPVGVPREQAQNLVYNDNWGQACANLRVLIAKAQQQAVVPTRN